MPSSARTITIDRSIDDVFQFFADVRNDPEWRGREHVKKISLDGEMREGARIQQTLAAGPFGAPIKSDMDVVVYRPSTALGFQVTTGPVRPRVDFSFAAEGAGTVVTFTVDAPLVGAKKMLMGSIAQRNVDHAAAALSEAKRLLEAPSSR